jgi:hypothetical protein
MFVVGFVKVAGLRDGLKAAAGETVGSALTFGGARKALGELGQYRGRYKQLLSTGEGRNALRGAAAQSLPSAVAAGLYYKGVKKVHRKLQERSQNAYDSDQYGQSDFPQSQYPSM